MFHICSGWWLIQTPDGASGWAPASYLQPTDTCTDDELTQITTQCKGV